MKTFQVTLFSLFFSITLVAQEYITINFDDKGKEYVESTGDAVYDVGQTNQGLVVREDVVVNASEVVQEFQQFELSFWFKTEEDLTEGLLHFETEDKKTIDVEIRKGQLRLVKGNSIFPLGTTNNDKTWQQAKLSFELMEDFGKWKVKLIVGTSSKETFLGSNKKPAQLLFGRSTEEKFNGILDEIVINIIEKETIVEEEKVNEPAIIVKTGCQEISLAMWDDGEVDKDVVNVDLNGKLLKSSITLKKKKYTLEFVPEEGKNELKVNCLSAGTLSTNTVSLILSCKDIKGEPFQLSMEEGEFKHFVINHDPSLPVTFDDATNDPPMGKTKYLAPIALNSKTTFLKFKSDKAIKLPTTIGGENFPLTATAKEKEKPFQLSVGNHQLIIKTNGLKTSDNNLYLNVKDDLSIVNTYTIPLGDKINYVIPIRQSEAPRKNVTIVERIVKVKKIKLEIYDFQDEDGDSVAVNIDGEEVLKALLTKKIQTVMVDVPEEGQTIVSFVNLSEGTVPSNTLRVRLYQGNHREIINLSTKGVNRESRIILKYGFFVRDDEDAKGKN